MLVASAHKISSKAKYSPLGPEDLPTGSKPKLLAVLFF